MAQFPLNPKIGQSFLPNDEDVLYVWNGYTWEKRDFNSGSGGSGGSSGTSVVQGAQGAQVLSGGPQGAQGAAG